MGLIILLPTKGEFLHFPFNSFRTELHSRPSLFPSSVEGNLEIKSFTRGKEMFPPLKIKIIK
jgi:hypothetical protein